jgi:hypothetical protein
MFVPASQLVGQAYKLLIFDDGRCLGGAFLLKEYKYLGT